ncbi:MAG: 2Fe-2S iron-sulfur cluster-binding protein [Planctomycetota bacterium]
MSGRVEREFEVFVDGRPFAARSDWTLATLLLNEGHFQFRRAVKGGTRAPFCGVGICHECRVVVDDFRTVRACMTLCRPGLEVRTGGE